VFVRWPGTAAVVLAGAVAAVGRARSRDYRSAVDAATKRDDPLLDLGKAIAEAQQASVRVKEGEYAKVEVPAAQISGKQGYDYLHALFYARHRGLVRRPLYRRFAILAGLAAAAAVVVLAAGDTVSSFIAENAGTAVRYMVFAMLTLSLGEQLCRALFYHCDIHLMRYSFFRKDAPVHYRSRLFRLIGYNLGIAAALAAGLTLVFRLAGGVPGALFAQLWVLAAALAVFFAVHHMAMYYLFQPYSTEMNAKNPLYFVVSMAVSGACGASLFLRIPPGALAWIVGVLALVYAAASFVLVRKFAARTFRVK